MEFKLFVIKSIFLIYVVVNCVNSKLPSDIKRCKYSDEKCFIAEFDRLIQAKAKGDKELGLVNLDPLKINAIDIVQGAESPVNVELKFRNCGLYGLPTLRLVKAKGFGKDLKGPHEFHAKAPVIALLGDYSVKGNILILPISGSGSSNMTLINPHIIFHFDGKPIEKNGKTHFGIAKMVIRIKMDRIRMHYSNLFNGDKVLGDNMNLFLNENWKDVWGELENTVLRAFELIFKNVIQNVFEKYSYDEFFVE